MAAALLLFFIAFHSLAQEHNESEIDVFMRKALETRARDWDRRYNYVFRETEELRIRGDIGDAPFAGFTKEWAWYVKEGYLVRSPVSVDGMPVSEEKRKRSEESWIKGVKRKQRKGKKSDEDEFFGFEFEPGNYFFSGREMLNGHEVVKIEYYPNERLTEADIRKAEKNDDFDVQVEKSLAVTVYALPEENRIIRMVMHNAGMDFLPGQSILKVIDVRAWMDMFKAENGDWLVREFIADGTAAMASGNINVRYVRHFDDYRKAKVKVQFRFAPRKSGGGRDKNEDR